MSSVLIDHHDRLGDHLICHGIVRDHCARYDRVGIFANSKYRAVVAYMFRDLPNLHIELANTLRDRNRFLLRNRFSFGARAYDEVKPIDNYREYGVVFERQFYKSAGVEFPKKWTSFHVERDRAREQVLIAKVALPKTYIFLHDDARYPIDRTKIQSIRSVFRPDLSMTDIVFDYWPIIEQAEEIHVTDSSFMFLVDLLPYDNQAQKLFIHRYARGNIHSNYPVLKKNWKIIV